MTEFVGRTGALRLYSYPENRRAAALGLFARNFATGPKGDTAVEGEGVLIPWNSIDALSFTTPFTIAAGGITVSIPGDVTGSFSNGDTIDLIPSTPAALPAIPRVISSVPAFALGFTTFDLNALLNGSTTAGTLGTATNVPITPRSTGVVRISGVIVVQNTTGGPASEVEAFIQIDGTPLNPPAIIAVAPLADDQTAEIPFLAEVTLTVGVTANVSILVASDVAVDILADSSAIDLQEVSVATG